MSTRVKALVGAIDGSSEERLNVRKSFQGARAGRTRVGRLAVALMVVACGVLALGAGSAFASFTFPFDGELAPSGGSFGSLEAGSVAIDDANGDTYVADSASGVVDVFETATGSQLAGLNGSLTPAGSFGFGQVEVAANNGTGDVYVLDSTHNVVDVFSSAGGYVCQITGSATPSASECNGIGGSDTPAHGFSNPGGIAVDQATGNVYVVDAHNGAVDVFGAGGAYLSSSSISLSSIEGGFNANFTRGVAVDDFNGDVYISDSGSPNPASEDVVYVFNTAGEYQTAWTGIPGQAFGGGYVSVAADNTSGEVYVTSTVHGATAVFEASGGYITQFSHFFKGPQGTAVDQGTHKIYVSDNRPSVVDIFSPGPVLIPDVTTGSVSNANPTSATFEGTVNPDGVQIVACKFEYRTATGSWQSVACASEPGSGSSEVPVNAEATGLLPNATYYYRLTASNANGANSGEDATFTTPGPPTVDEESSANITPTSAVIQAQIKPNGIDTIYHFQYGTSIAYGTTAPIPDGDAGSGTVDIAQSVPIERLTPDTIYHYRVVAANSAGTTLGEDKTFVTLPPALIDSESVSRVTSTSATLATEINPLGRDTTYRFEYGPTAAYGTSLPVPNGVAGSGTADVTQSAPIEGLAPDTTYHYRVVTVNSLGTVEGADHVFKTQASQAPGLLDGRAWEMVSPPDKHGAALEAISPPFGGLIQAATDGGAITYLATGPVSDETPGNRSLGFTQVLSTRDADGWTSRNITTPTEETVNAPIESGGEYKLFSSDLSVGLVEPKDGMRLAEAATESTPYLREANGEYTPLASPADVAAGTKFESNVNFAGASADLSHVMLASPLALTPGFVSNGGSSLYEWSGGQLSLVSVLPDGKAAAEEGVSVGLGYSGTTRHAVSDDGSRIVWEGTLNATPHLYVRDMRLGGTAQIDAVEAGALGGPTRGPIFQTASDDGSKVFFLDEARLTRNATAIFQQPDLYMCEVGQAAGKPTCKLKDLTVDGHVGEAAAVQGLIVGAGEDGRYVYFVANGVLAAGAARGNNLYVEDTITGATRLVARMTNDDRSDWEVSTGAGGGLLAHTSRVSPSGRYLAFMSLRSLTGYDNLDARSGQPDAEVFLYDANTGLLVCASCNPSGARPAGVFDAAVFPGLLVDRFESTYWAGHWLAGSIPGWDNQQYRGNVNSFYGSRYLSDSGRLFFNAADGLVPGDTNGLEDVYEYEPGGVGGCAGGSGCVGLISSGTSSEESALLDASESGSDVFFLTASRLAPQDTDSALDVYDAHVCTSGSPCIAPPSTASLPIPCASGDGCRGLAAAQPGVFGAPASTGVAGAGNLAPPLTTKLVVKAKPVSRARKLASALRACRKKARHRQRATCEAHARRLYGKGARAGNAGGAGAMRKGNG